MNRWLSMLALLTGLLALAGCAAEEKATPAPASPTAAVKPAWEQEWEQTVAAAKREGKVAVAGPVGTDVRRALTEPFEKKYGISVEYLGQRGAEFGTRVRTERAAGQYLWDVYIGGTTTAITVFKEIEALDPIEPALILPEVKDPNKWRGGGLEFVDKDRLILAMTNFVREAFAVNSNLVKADDFKSWKDLLDPKWKGKILLHDPRMSGAGNATMHFLYAHPELGPDFIRALLKQEPIVARDQEQLARWLAEGRAPIQVGSSNTALEPLIRAGLPIGYVDARQVKEGGSVHVGVGGLALFSKAPHPNAAKVYLNWLLTREAQTDFAVVNGYASRRLDVPTGHVDVRVVPVAGVSYIRIDDEAKVWEQRNVVLPFLESILGR